MTFQSRLFLGLFLTLFSVTSSSKTLPVGAGKTYANPGAAAMVAVAGDTILIYPGNYTGTYFINNLKGKSHAYIVIMGTNKNSVFLSAGSEGLHLSEVAYVKIQDLTFTAHTSNAMNVDDGGKLTSPSKHVIISQCDFKYMGAQGNNDFLKLSGLDSFTVSYSTFHKGATGGSGIDMVGCHYGWVHHCHFDSMGSNCVQMKGGTQFIKIENNVFKNGGQRSLNLGGSTGYAFFRPQNAKFEAADIAVYSNEFIGGLAPIAYVGAERIDVANNTIILPEKWIIRILQETADTPRFVPCRNNMFRNNIIYFSNAVTTHVNIGSNTLPATFLFSHNLWYNLSNPANSSPSLPSTESNSIRGSDPLFVSSNNYRLQKNSPAIQSGTLIPNLPKDMLGFTYKNPPSRGAYEFEGSPSRVNMPFKNKPFIYPNPALKSVVVANLTQAMQCTVINSKGDIVIQQSIQPDSPNLLIDDLSSGIYYLRLEGFDGEYIISRFIKE